MEKKNWTRTARRDAAVRVSPSADLLMADDVVDDPQRRPDDGDDRRHRNGQENEHCKQKNFNAFKERETGKEYSDKTMQPVEFPELLRPSRQASP